MSTTSSCQPPIIKQLGSVTVWKRVNSRVKTLAGVKTCVFLGNVAPKVAKVGSLFPRVRGSIWIHSFVRSFFHPSTIHPSLHPTVQMSHGFIASLVQWFTESVSHWFIDSLFHWFIDSLAHSCMGSLIHWIAGSLSHWFTESLLIHRFI